MQALFRDIFRNFATNGRPNQSCRFHPRFSVKNPFMNHDREHNRRAWNDRVRQRKTHTGPASERDFQNPWAVLDECGWLEKDLRGKRVLCLAAGGGKHGVLFAAVGAQVTVVDLSPAMLALDRTIAQERGLKLEVVQTSMDDLSMFAPGFFDLVIQPVSTCYLPDVRAVYQQVARVVAPGSLYISQHKQPASLQADLLPSPRGYLLHEPYYRTGPLPGVVEGCPHREAGTLEFLHRLEDLLGGLCQSGFVIEDLLEPRHADPRAEPGTFQRRCLFLPPYLTVKARRISASSEVAKIWMP